MRSILFLMIVTLFLHVLHAKEQYCIEVLSTKDKTSITREIMDKVIQMKHSHSVRYMDGEYKLILGNFETSKAAEAVLDEVRTNINKEAVVTLYQEKKRASQLDSKAKMQQAMLMAQAKALTKTKVNEEHNITIEEVSQIFENCEENVTEKESVKNVTLTEPRSVEIESFCKSSKKALREAEISEALEFYKNSSFYSFNE